MGVLSQVVVAPRGAARAVLAAIHPEDGALAVDAKGLDPEKLSALAEILLGSPCDADLTCDDRVSGPWVYAFADALVTELAALDLRARGEASRRWARTEELRLDAWRTPDAARVLDAMSRLARAAVATDRAVYLWMSV